MEKIPYSRIYYRFIYWSMWVGRVVRRCWVNFQCRGVLLIWITVGQGPTTLAVGAGGGCLDIFTLIYHFSILSPSLWETARLTEILSQRAVKPQKKHPAKCWSHFRRGKCLCLTAKKTDLYSSVLQIRRGKGDN